MWSLKLSFNNVLLLLLFFVCRGEKGVGEEGVCSRHTCGGQETTESVLSFVLFVEFRAWTQVSRLVQQIPLPTEPSSNRLPHCTVFPLLMNLWYSACVVKWMVWLKHSVVGVRVDRVAIETNCIVQRRLPNEERAVFPTHSSGTRNPERKDEP